MAQFTVLGACLISREHYIDYVLYHIYTYYRSTDALRTSNPRIVLINALRTSNPRIALINALRTSNPRIARPIHGLCNKPWILRAVYAGLA